MYAFSLIGYRKDKTQLVGDCQCAKKLAYNLMTRIISKSSFYICNTRQLYYARLAF